ncbi:MAG: enoyl-CoA hydratase/isomerase family protein, partial [bacterium]|nr:enoyl-CoA hydratase/isomerase family protein [bacterium]
MEDIKLKETTDIKINLEYPYAIIRIDRQGNTYNTFVPSMISEFDEVLKIIEHDAEIRVVIVTGNDRVFSTGVDVLDPSIYNMDPMQARYFSRLGKKMFGRLEDIDIPTVAAINGAALGGGLELALTCDFRIASERAMFGLPESNLGIIPGWGGTQRLLRHLGYSRALELILSGEIIKAREAYETGLVQTLVPKGEDVVEASKKWSERFTSRSRVALAMCKKAVRMAADLPLKYGEEYEADLFGLAWASQHREIGIDSFKNREKPDFPLDFG